MNTEQAIDLKNSKFGPHIDHLLDQEVSLFVENKYYWIYCHVNTSIGWPSKNQSITYKGWVIVLHGFQPTAEKHNIPCFSVWYEKKENEELALKLAYDFSTVMGWFLRGYVSPKTFNGGGRCPLGLPKRSSDSIIVAKPFINLNYIPQTLTEAERTSLAFWREGLTLEEINIGYSFLSYFKVIEYNLGADARVKWMKSKLATPNKATEIALIEIREYTEAPDTYLFHSCRCAVAHADASKEIVDPDEPSNLLRLRKSLPLIKSLAQQYISLELGIPTEMDAYCLRDNYSILHRSSCNANCIDLIVDVEICPSRKLNNLNGSRIREIAKNSVSTEMVLTDDKNFALSLLINHETRMISILPQNLVIRHYEDCGDPKVELDVYELLLAIYFNKRLEFKTSEGDYISCEEFLPNNINLGATQSQFQNRIDEISEYIKKLT